MSLAAFRTDLYQEHFEEVAGMYECWRGNLDDLESTLADLADLESRMEAHLDALEIGGALALEVAESGLAVDDPSSLYAWVMLACRLGRFELLEPVFEQLEAYCSDEGTDPDDAEMSRTAVGDGLSHGLTPALEPAVVKAVAVATSHVVPVLAAAVGRRRLKAAAELAAAVQRPCADLEPVMRALSRVAGDARLLHAQIGTTAAHVGMSAALGMLRMGETSAVAALQYVGRSETWPCVPLALCTGRSASVYFEGIVSGGRCDTNVLTALGLHGDPAAIDTLLSGLEASDEALGEAQAIAAAWALHLITGAGLVEPEPEVVEAGPDRPNRVSQPVTDQEVAAAQANPTADPEPEDEDEDEDEDDAHSGPYIECDPQFWRDWMAEHRGQLVVGQRHRLGVLAQAHSDLDLLASPRIALHLRRLLADEFVIRYAVESGYEVDRLGNEQYTALSAARSSVQSQAVRWKAGVWYFQGQGAN